MRHRIVKSLGVCGIVPDTLFMMQRSRAKMHVHAMERPENCDIFSDTALTKQENVCYTKIAHTYTQGFSVIFGLNAEVSRCL
jgi:hypothetical protein